MKKNKVVRQKGALERWKNYKLDPKVTDPEQAKAKHANAKRQVEILEEKLKGVTTSL